MLCYDRIDISAEIDVAKSNNSKESLFCHYWHFIHGFKFQKFVCNGCHALLMLCINISDITIITIIVIDYRFIVYDINNSDAINLLENSVLDDYGYIKNLFQRNQYEK